MYDLIIIGGGPAGITAGIYASRKKLNTLVIAKNFISQTGWASSIENYPGFLEVSGMDLMAKFREHLGKFAVDINEGEEVKKIEKNGDIFKVWTSQNDNYTAKAVLVASGRDPRPLEVPGEKEFIGRGVSYCVTCDGPVFNGKTVAVIGGGNSGFYAARELTKYCPKIYIFESSAKPKADEMIQEQIKQSGKAEIITNAKVTEIKGSGFVGELTYQDQLTKESKILPIGGIFIEIGSIPATGFLKGLVDFNDKDEIIIDLKTGQTKTPGLFAAGDVTNNKYKQIVIACGEGAKTALSAYEYIESMK